MNEPNRVLVLPVQSTSEMNESHLKDIKALLTELVAETRKLVKSLGFGNSVDSPWLNSKSAAKYLDISVERFREIAREEGFPRYGKYQNTFSKYDLDRWLDDPRCFIPSFRPVNKKNGDFWVSDMLNRLIGQSQNGQ